MRTADPGLPAELRVRWRDLPRHANVLRRRFYPPLLRTPVTEAVCWCMWMFQLAVQHASGRLIGYGSAILLVRRSRNWARALYTGAAYVVCLALLMILALAVALAAGLAVAVFNGPAVATFNLVLIGTGVALWLEAFRPALRIREQRAVLSACRARARDGEPWWEAAQLVAAEGDPVSAGRLLHAALRYADTHGIGIVAGARDARLDRAYRRLGFVPDPAYPPALVRTPAPQ